MERATGVGWRGRWRQWHIEGSGRGSTETATGWYGEGGGGSGGMETVTEGVQRGRWQRHGEGGSSGTERVMAVACRGWVDGVGGASLWAGSMLGL